MTADPINGTWRRQFSNQRDATQREVFTFNSDQTGTLLTVAGKPQTSDQQPTYFQFADTFEWHKSNAGGHRNEQIAVRYFLTVGQRAETTQFDNKSMSYEYTISDDGAMLTLTGFNDGNGGDDGTVAPPAVFTRQ